MIQFISTEESFIWLTNLIEIGTNLDSLFIYIYIYNFGDNNSMDEL